MFRRTTTVLSVAGLALALLPAAANAVSADGHSCQRELSIRDNGHSAAGYCSSGGRFRQYRVWADACDQGACRAVYSPWSDFDFSTSITSAGYFSGKPGTWGYECTTQIGGPAEGGCTIG